MAVTAGKLWGATNKVELQRWNSMDRVLETLWQYYLVRRSNKKARRVRLDIYTGGHPDRVINMVASEIMEHGLAFDSVISLS